MNIREFIKKESDKFEPPFMEHPIDMFQFGLTKGLEIATEFGDWINKHRYIKDNNDLWVIEYNRHHKHTTSELLTIFLTEKTPK